MKKSRIDGVSVVCRTPKETNAAVSRSPVPRLGKRTAAEQTSAEQYGVGPRGALAHPTPSSLPLSFLHSPPSPPPLPSPLSWFSFRGAGLTSPKQIQTFD